MSATSNTPAGDMSNPESSMQFIVERDGSIWRVSLVLPLQNCSSDEVSYKLL